MDMNIFSDVLASLVRNRVFVVLASAVAAMCVRGIFHFRSSSKNIV